MIYNKLLSSTFFLKEGVKLIFNCLLTLLLPTICPRSVLLIGPCLVSGSVFNNTDWNLCKGDILWSVNYRIFEIPWGIGSICITVVLFPIDRGLTETGEAEVICKVPTFHIILEWTQRGHIPEGSESNTWHF